MQPQAPSLPQIELVTRSSPVELDVSDLISLALRHNPRRAHLWVSKVLGKHVGVHPHVALGCGRLLGGLVDALLHDRPVPDRWAAAAAVALSSNLDPSALLREIPCAAIPSDAPTVGSWRGADGPVVIGFAETATALGSAVAEALGARFSLHSTRRPSELVPTAGTFEEGHSHATTHLLTPWPSHRLAGTDPLVLVDDELSTGHTARATIGQLHEQFPGRSHYIVATLVDLRSDADSAALQQWADEQGLRVDVVSLVAATATIPADFAVRAAAHIQALHALAPEVPPIETVEATDLPPAAPLADLTLDWPAGLRQGGRFGTAGGSVLALYRAAAQVATRLEAALPADARRVLVIGTEEFLYLPMLIAAQWVGRDVRFQSTTRSPVHAEHTAGYPIRRRLRFGDRPGGSADDGEAARFLYNADWLLADGSVTEADAIVLICDDAPADAVRAVAALQIPYLVARLPADRPWPEALTGPAFGSYPSDEVSWLLTDLSDADLEGAVGEREQRVQSGAEHYAESLPVEYQPGPEYTELFHRMLDTSADRLALAVAVLTDLVIAERGEDLTLVSLARAGTPIGVLMRRWAARRGLALPHYSVSIVRDRGIDPVALEHLARHHDPATVVFVDGWTGKGAITVELAQALEAFRAETGVYFDPTIAVLADPGSCTPLHGTRDDFLIASACLNSTVSGLVSRTVLNPDLTSPQQFHGAKFYAELAAVDLSNVFVDTVAARFDDIAAQVPSALAALQASDRTPTHLGMAAVEAVRERYGLPSVNLVKPGVGETTRVLLRRVPWKVLVREPESPDHLHIRLLAADRAVPVEHVPDLPYACMGLIRPIGST